MSGIFFGENLQQLPLALVSDKFALKFVSVCLYMSFSFVSKLFLLCGCARLGDRTFSPSTVIVNSAILESCK